MILQPFLSSEATPARTEASVVPEDQGFLGPLNCKTVGYVQDTNKAVVKQYCFEALSTLSRYLVMSVSLYVHLFSHHHRAQRLINLIPCKAHSTSGVSVLDPRLDQYNSVLILVDLSLR
jgi:hypothetical protein